jgi:hypothetical protein
MDKISNISLDLANLAALVAADKSFHLTDMPLCWTHGSLGRISSWKIQMRLNQSQSKMLGKCKEIGLEICPLEVSNRILTSVHGQ